MTDTLQTQLSNAKLEIRELKETLAFEEVCHYDECEALRAEMAILKHKLSMKDKH